MQELRRRVAQAPVRLDKEGYEAVAIRLGSSIGRPLLPVPM
jgi:hypothetical protein